MPSAPSITVGVTAEVAEEWSWAAAHARIPQILALTLSLPEALENVRVAVTVEDGPEVFGSTVAFEGELASGVTTPRSVHLPLSARAMAGVDERRAGECVIRVEDRATGSLLGEYRQAVDILPRDLWSWSGDPRRKEQIDRLKHHYASIQQRLEEVDSGAEADELVQQRAGLERALANLLGHSRLVSRSLLASFSRPNHPDVLMLAREAAAIRGKRTGDPSFSAFQADDVAEAEREVEASVSAIYEALQARQISYSEPPPGWDYAESGQRIRDHGAVARSGLGTCMDTTVLTAAVIEHVGLLPVMVLIQGHIFIGYWRRNPEPPANGSRPEWFPATPAMNDAARIVELVEGGWLGLIETTAFTAGRRTSAADARVEARRRLESGLADGPVWIIDVAEARKAGVSPLPAVQERADGVTEVIEYRPGGARDVTEVPTPTREATGERIVDAHPPRYRTWKSSLFTLNARNALLNLGSGPSVQPLVLPPSGLGELEDRLNQDVEFELLSGYSIPRSTARERSITRPYWSPTTSCDSSAIGACTCSGSRRRGRPQARSARRSSPPRSVPWRAVQRRRTTSAA
ncbi:hypothetical protein [Microbacterium aurantiacum]|uniref:hypothetical protein n=1 Tax=Microbacterium aurantiacum TaxID=162393 RepID=UPI0012E77EA9|nr:hypothetical protein [Microbacterium chocolatum]